MWSDVSRRFRRHFQIVALLIVIILLIVNKSHIADVISYLKNHDGIVSYLHYPNKGRKDTADAAGHIAAKGFDSGHMLPFYKPYSGGIASEYYEASLYIISGTVTSQKGSPLPGATVFVYSRWWDTQVGLVSMAFSPEPIPLVKQICDVYGRYLIALGAPFKGVLVVEKDGFAQQFEEIKMPFAGALIKNFGLRPAVACLEGSVSDQDGNPLAGVNIYAVLGSVDSSILSPLVTKSDGMGRYRIHSIPNGDGLVFAVAERHLGERCDITFEDRNCAHCDFVLKNAVDVRLEIKNRQGEAIPYAHLCGKGVSNAKGEARLPLPIGTLPFDCKISAPGYRDKHITVDPENSISKIILDKGGPTIEGRVVTDSGLPVEHAKVSVSESGTVYTDRDGGFEIPLGHGGDTEIAAYRAGYVENRQSLNIEGDGLKNIVIVMSRATGGIYGRVVGSDGSPVARFRIELENDGKPHYVYYREFENPNGMFYINDVPAGSYSFHVVPATQATLDRFFSFLSPSIEIKKDYTYGEMYIELPAR